MDAVNPATCRIKGLSIGELAPVGGSGNIRHPDEEESDADDDDPLKEPPPETWIYEHIPGRSKHDWQRGIVSKWLRLRFGNAIHYVNNHTSVTNLYYRTVHWNERSFDEFHS